MLIYDAQRNVFRWFSNNRCIFTDLNRFFRFLRFFFGGSIGATASSSSDELRKPPNMSTSSITCVAINGS